MKQPIQLEPHSAFQAAIVKTDKKGFITYNYYKLIDVCKDLYEMTDEDAVEWVDYNICGLAVNGFKVSYAKPRR